MTTSETNGNGVGEVMVIHRKRKMQNKLAVCRAQSDNFFLLTDELGEMPPLAENETACEKCFAPWLERETRDSADPLEAESVAAGPTEDAGEDLISGQPEPDETFEDVALREISGLTAKVIELGNKVDSLVSLMDRPEGKGRVVTEPKTPVVKPKKGKAKKGEPMQLTFFECSGCGQRTSARGMAWERFNAKLCPSCWAAKAS